MEKKLLKIIELANELSEKQKNVYAKIEYTSNDSKRLEVSIISKKDFSFIERCSIQFNGDLLSYDLVIRLLELYTGGKVNE